MAAPKEVGLRVEDFLGVNVQVSSEDLQDQFFVKMQNLYERKIGELQRRGGAANLTATAVPTNITKFVGQNYLKDKILGKTRILKTTCTDMGNTAYDATAKITLSFPTDVTAKWGASTVGITNGVVNADSITLVAVGFGYFKTISYTTSGSYPVSGDTKKLRIVISSALADKNITHIEVYGLCTFSFPGGVARKDYVYIGNIDLLTSSTGTFDFKNGPISLTADPGAASIGTTDTVFTAVSASNSGSLSPTKTYYVALMRLYLKNANDTTSRIEYVTDTVTPVTINAGHDSILVTKTSGGSAVTLLAVGLHPQCLTPVGIISNDSTFSYYITALPPFPVSAIGYTRFDASTNRLYFKTTDISRTEMFAKIVSDVWVPIPISNFCGFNTDRYFQNAGDDTQVFPPFIAGLPGTAFTVTTDAKYTFDQYFNMTQDLLFGLGRGQTNKPNISSISHNIVQCDGRIASMAILEYGTGSPPIASYPLVFKEKLCLGGGPSDAFNRIYFSLVTNCYNFGVPGASATAQYVQVESGGEEVSGIGQYTNTSSQTGPLNQIVVGKQNSLFILSDLPTYSSGSLNNAVMTGLSRKVGVANHDCIKNSEIGTIIASRDNVWLVRETGEPVPLGHEISYFLRPQDPSVVVDPSNWNACVHDNRYKLSFSVSGSAIPSQELWLNIGKMKQMKGQPCWEGPHTGREVRYSFNEEQFLDTIIPKRICVDNANLRWYQGDREDVVQDFTTDIACILEGRNFPMGDPNYPKNFTGTMWRLKADTSFVFTEDLITLSDSAGESTLSASRTAAPYTGYAGGTYATFLNCRAKAHSYFPASRIRGETLRLKWSYQGQAFFAISGFTAFYEVERRKSNT